jgi:drug/metabolite transporter (DMT)-like permease
MSINISRRAGFGLAGLAVLLVFIADTRTPSGVTDWLLYALPLLMVSGEGERRLTYALAGFCTVLIVAGLVLSPPSGVALEFDVLNRALSNWSEDT